MNTTENNKLLAEFMGYIDNGCSEEGFLISPITNYDEDICELKYHSDWNWLMQVVEKIESFKGDKDVIHWSRNNRTIFDLKLTECKIQTVYKACTEFVKWHNENRAKENYNQ